MKLRSHLIVLIVVALLPLLVFAGVMIVRYDSQQRAAVESQMIDTTRALSLAVDREAVSWASALEALGSSRHLDAGNLSAFREEAARLLKTRKDWNNILLTDLEGRQLLNLFVPLGSPLPHVRDLTQFQQAIKTSRPVASNLFLGRVSREHVIGVAVPVVHDGKVKFVLASSTSPNSLLRILAEQEIPPDWIGTIVDRKGIVMGRTRNFQEFFGKPAMALRGAPSGEVKEGFGRGTSEEGTELQVAFHRSELTGWTTRLAIPVPVLEAPLRRSLWITAGGGFALLLAGIGVAMLFGRRVASSIGALSDAAAALGRSETPQGLTFPVSELNDVAAAIQDAAVRRRRAEAEIQRNLERLRTLREIEHAVSSSLDLSTILRLLVERAGTFLPPESVTTVRLLDTTTGEFEPVACRNIDEEEWKTRERKIGSDLPSIVMENKGPLIMANVQTDPRRISREFAHRHGLVSYLGVPLLVKGEVLGLLSFYTKELYQFTIDEIEFLSMLADQAAIAIHNSQLHTELMNQAGALATSNEDLATRTRQQAVVSHLGLFALAGVELSKFLDKTTKVTAETLQVEYCEALELLPDKTALLLRAGAGWKEGYVGDATVPADTNFQEGYTLHFNQPVIVYDLPTERRFSAPRLLSEHGVVSGITVPITGKERPFGVLGVHTSRLRNFTQEDINFLQSAANLLAAVIQERQTEEEVMRSRSELRNLAAHLQSVQEEARSEIAREIHDEFGQTLTALKMDLSWLQKKLPKGQDALLEKTKSMLALLDQAIQVVRRIATRLRPSVLDDLGLVAAIEWQLQDFQSRTGIKGNFTSRLREGQLDRELSTALFRIFQETLTNIARHASADKVRISVEQKDGDLLLQVSDNGRGISEDKISDPTSLGLLGMRERALLLGGEVRIRGGRGKGTTVAVRVPLTHHP